MYALIFLKYIESFGRDLFTNEATSSSDRSKSGIRCSGEESFNEGRQKFEEEKTETRRPMEVRTLRKQREVYSAQINRVNLQSNGALLNTNALHNDELSPSLHLLYCSKLGREIRIFHNNSRILYYNFFAVKISLSDFQFRFLQNFAKYHIY